MDETKIIMAEEGSHVRMPLSQSNRKLLKTCRLAGIKAVERGYISQNEVETPDDCSPFILTLTPGPVELTGHDAEALLSFGLGSQPEKKLPRQMSAALLSGFASSWT